MKLTTLNLIQSELQLGNKTILFYCDKPVAMILNDEVVPAIRFFQTKQKFPKAQFINRTICDWLRSKGCEEPIKKDQTFFDNLFKTTDDFENVEY